MTKEECIKRQDEYKKIKIHNDKVCVTPTGKILDWNGKEFLKRKWRYNNDGYPVVSITGYNCKKEKIYRTIAVHILVALAWVENPHNKPEVNHLDFNRKNPTAYNLEWVTHKENISYSYEAGHYKGQSGQDNPNYGNKTLHNKYATDKKYSKQKQSRPGGQNGRAKHCKLLNLQNNEYHYFDFQRAAVYYLIDIGIVPQLKCPETIISHLKDIQGYKGYRLILQ